MTIVVATPYLDEAERCHRVALMHEGVIHQTGLQRLEVRASDLSRAETLLSSVKGIAEVLRIKFLTKPRFFLSLPPKNCDNATAAKLACLIRKP